MKEMDELTGGVLGGTFDDVVKSRKPTMKKRKQAQHRSLIRETL